MSGYPSWFYPLLTVLLALLLISGLLLLPVMLEMRLDMEVPWRPDADSRLLAAACHAGVGFLLLGFVGALFPIHIRVGWYQRLNWIGGAALLGLFAVMLVTVLGIYYFGDPWWSQTSSVLHLAAGLISVGFFLWHWRHGRRLRMQTTRG